jgi:hypothetical protein
MIHYREQQVVTGCLVSDSQCYVTVQFADVFLALTPSQAEDLSQKLSSSIADALRLHDHIRLPDRSYTSDITHGMGPF